jgi:DNA-binding NarL/FixJ family response regulator
MLWRSYSSVKYEYGWVDDPVRHFRQLTPDSKLSSAKIRTNMKHNEITVAVGGGRLLEQAGLSALITSLPGLRVVAIDYHTPPQVLVWITSASTGILPTSDPETAVVLLTEQMEDQSLPEKVRGLFSKDEPPASLGIAIRQVARGDQYISPSLAVAIIQARQQESNAPEPPVVDSLTDREQEILKLLAQGLSNKMIAARLYLSVRTVEGHLANIYSRLGVHSRTEAMLMAVKIPKNIGTTLAPPARAGESGSFT